ncbi:alpha/beta fold hydrolase [Gordonia sp. NPDC003585]|uniref:alpha/beta hydrolase family protein n=1 Tax=Gordonia sp. NPDC003585 TaxID=3154275 RepID=UPI0033B22C64
MRTWRDVRVALIAVSASAALIAGCSSDPSPPPEFAGPLMGAPIADGRSPEPTALAAAPETRAVKGYSVTRLPYRTRRAGDPAQNFADLYLPDGKHPSRSVPLVILVHGGSWKAEYDLTMMRPFAIDLVRRGFAVYNIEFRRVGSGGGWPTTFTDAADAVNGLVDLARTRPQLDLAETVILGYSSGGQLATWLACRHRLSGNRTVSHELGSTPRFRPARVVSVSAPLAMAFAAEHGNSRIVALMGGTPEQVPERYRAVDPPDRAHRSAGAGDRGARRQRPSGAGRAVDAIHQCGCGGRGTRPARGRAGQQSRDGRTARDGVLPGDPGHRHRLHAQIR